MMENKIFWGHPKIKLDRMFGGLAAVECGEGGGRGLFHAFSWGSFTPPAHGNRFATMKMAISAKNVLLVSLFATPENLLS